MSACLSRLIEAGESLVLLPSCSKAGLALYPGCIFLCSKEFSRIIIFRGFNHQLVDKKY